MSEARFLPQIFFERAHHLARERAFHYCRPRDRKWVDMTWRKYREEVCILAGWLRSKGVKKGDKIALLSGNRPEWLITDMAIMSLGAVTVPVYATASQNDVTYIMEHSESSFLIVDTLDRAEMVKELNLEGVVTFDRGSKQQADGFKSPITAMADIRKEKKLAIENPIDLKDDDVATIIYTSGTTGRPKGVVHSHKNFAEGVKPTYDILKRDDGEVDRFFSFLPLSHVAERMLVVVGSIVSGSEVAFARSIDTLAEDLVRCRPTILLCVPRLWEKIYEKINAGLLVASPVKRAIFSLARRLGESRIQGDHIFARNDQKLPAKISDILVGKKLRTKLGLDRCRMLVTGAAPTRPEVMRFFGSFGMRIREVYGLTENLCLGVLNDSEEVVIGSCGKPFPGNEIKIAEDDEILFRAHWNFDGYYKNPEATAEVLKDGWFHTGDLGKLDSDGRLRIVGRKKELLKTSGGKYVAPVPIEDSIKAEPCVAEAMVVGDERKYCVALISLNEEVIAGKDPSEYKEALKKHLESVNSPLASFETVKRVGVLKQGFSVEDGSLTPTLKVKRAVVADKKSNFIEKLYHSEDAVIFE
ncbi:AMP-dependent synthetase/ligase [Pseudobacteriovorax antillogorgiicola]|uniref:Long-chain acyl-CoA synthetase n=1 Tax=Pseudobacteriovorax antillogorgiicola TaxID=1513793 RepID=A0A1Y6BL51_9BACT|nr:long-chain fatty acid--CoA ligase [Pseudobacteriovorax antillogorgiicola]TCS55286.1 long-chain acyl-CoA synthetase [Pseudobacteriovorax antillogorgiicola]SMF14760.1 long-chain acyl-CoA synthetase [Pseudobacteriovorax antillogorgiicola]